MNSQQVPNSLIYNSKPKTHLQIKTLPKTQKYQKKKKSIPEIKIPGKEKKRRKKDLQSNHRRWCRCTSS